MARCLHDDSTQSHMLSVIQSPPHGLVTSAWNMRRRIQVLLLQSSGSIPRSLLRRCPRMCEARWRTTSRSCRCNVSTRLQLQGTCTPAVDTTWIRCRLLQASWSQPHAGGQRRPRTTWVASTGQGHPAHGWCQTSRIGGTSPKTTGIPQPEEVTMWRSGMPNGWRPRADSTNWRMGSQHAIRPWSKSNGRWSTCHTNRCVKTWGNCGSQNGSRQDLNMPTSRRN